MKKLFLLLCILGIVLPYYHLINFLILNEGSMEGFFSDIFSTHPMGMISMDLTVAATTFLIFLIYKAVKDKMYGLVVFMSLALPLYLYDNYEKI